MKAPPLSWAAWLAVALLALAWWKHAGVIEGELRQRIKARESVIVPFAPLPGSKAGELMARFDVVLGFTPKD